MAFYQRVNALLRQADTVLDVGCGRGEYAEDTVAYRVGLRTLRGKCAAVIGIDRDFAAQANPCIDEFRPITAAHWPVADGEIDLCLIDSVLEHVEDTNAFFGECRRVLKPGGYLCLRTPNAFGYPTIMARIIPNAAHAAVLARVQRGRKAADIFPTLYHCNSPRKLRGALRRNGFEACVYGYGPAPAYLDFSASAYALGVIWAAAAPSVVQAELHSFARLRT
jgi:SAM-dependent methyltransferase